MYDLIDHALQTRLVKNDSKTLFADIAQHVIDTSHSITQKG